MRMVIGTLVLLLPLRALAAGAVVGEPGSCMIEFGIYTAHFTVYQTDSRGNQAFCEDLPDTGRTLFVLDYLHGDLQSVPVDFRIIRDDEEWGIFARWENIRQIADIEARTVFYQPGVRAAARRLEVEHNFLKAGDYIGIVSAPHPTKDLAYHAVFPFSVGLIQWPIWLLVLLVATAGMAWWWRSR